ncbi:MAG: zinc-ribbon domain-containing protein [Peptococcia bacterium]|jgi:ribosomal protein L32
MTFFNKLKKKVSCFVQSAAQKSGEVMEITKLNMNIKTEKDGIESLYHQLGEYCFQKYNNGETNDSTVAGLCEKVKIHLENIDFFEVKINEIKNMVVCSSCGNKILKTNKFCSKCGAKVNAQEEQVEEKVEWVEEKTEQAELEKKENSDGGENTEL